MLFELIVHLIHIQFINNSPKIWTWHRNVFLCLYFQTLTLLASNFPPRLKMWWNSWDKNYASLLYDHTCDFQLRPLTRELNHQGPFHYQLAVILVWLGNYTHYKAWGEITYPFQKFNSGIGEVWEWINNLIPHFTEHVISAPGLFT